MNDNKGWICPVCGKGLAPWKSECSCVHGEESATVNIHYPTKMVQPVFDPWGDLPKYDGPVSMAIRVSEATSELS